MELAFLNNLQFWQLLILTAVASGTIIGTVWSFVIGISKLTFKIKYRGAVVEKMVKTNKKSIVSDISSDIKQNIKEYMKDIYLIVSKVTEIVSRQEHLRSVQKIQNQMIIAEDSLSKKRSKMEALFLDCLDDILKEKGEHEVRDNIIAHPDFTLYTLILDIINQNLKDTIRMQIKEEVFETEDINSPLFLENTEQKIDNVIITDTRTVNQFYLYHKDLAPSTLYKINKDFKDELRLSYRLMYRKMKEASNKVEEQVEDLGKQLSQYIESYMTEGAENTLMHHDKSN